MAAPVVFGEVAAGRLARHGRGCALKSGQPLGCRPAAAHTSRVLCGDCLDDFDLDRELVCEILSRDLIVDALFAILAMAEKYGSAKVVADDHLFVALMKYDHLQHAQNVLNSDELQEYTTRPKQSLRKYGRALTRRSSTTSLNDDSISLPSTPVNFPSANPLSASASPLRARLTSERTASLQFRRGEYAREGPLHSRMRSCISEKHWQTFCGAYLRRITAEGRPYYGTGFLQTKLPYTVCVDDETLFVAVKHDPAVSTSKVQIFAQVWLDVQFEGLLAVMAEVDMTHRWVPSFKFPIKVGLREASQLARQARMERTSLYKVDLPWPVTNRQVYLHGWLADDLDNRSATMVFRSIEPKGYPYHPLLYPIDPSNVGGDAKFTDMFVEGACVISNIGGARLNLKLWWNIDLKAKIPNMLLSFVCNDSPFRRTFIRLGLNALKKACQDACSSPEWRTARERDAWLYEYARQRSKV